MKIRKMTATFGCLDQAVLEPADGLNIYVLPNESGKSTWAAFLTAMLYGIDTSQRAARGRLPEKTRWQPWNGKPMEGTLELEHQGRTLVIQRTSQRGKPLGAFRAWDKDTGLDVPELTASNCGQKLLGVERAVFQRSAFLCGADLSVTQDQDLARRLGALAATGREGDSYPQAAEALKLWQNRCRYHKTGRIPETEDRLRQAQGTLEAVEDLRRQRLARTAELERLTAQAARMEEEQRQNWEDRQLLLRSALEQAHLRAEAKRSQAAALPAAEDLRRLQRDLERCAATGAGTEPPCPAALEGLTAEMIWPKAQRDQAEYERLTAMPKRATGGFLALALGSLAALVPAAVLELWWCVILLAGLSGFGWFRWSQQRRHNRQAEENRTAAAALLASYGVANKEALLTAAMTRRDWLLSRERAQRQEWELAVTLEEVRGFAPQAESPAAALEAVARALRLQEQAAEAQRELERAQLQWNSAAPQTVDPQAEALRRQCARLQAERESLASQEASLGGWEAVHAKVQALTAELAELSMREQALSLAREALASANSQLAQVYAPQLTKLAGDYLKKLTQGRYDGLVLEEDLVLSARESATGLVRPLAALSRGTQDQTWLALRLAMTRLLLPPDAPILLDDALLTFDRDREQAAQAVLAGEERQVLLFACR